MKALLELKIPVPERIRMAGIDEGKYATLLPVPLTTIHQPCAEIGETAIETMIQRLQDPEFPARDTALNFSLIVRRSSGAATVNRDRPTLAESDRDAPPSWTSARPADNTK